MPRPTRTRIAIVESMPARPKGASLAPICKAAGWQAEATSAAGSGLRQSGYVVERAKPKGKTTEVVSRITPSLEMIG